MKFLLLYTICTIFTTGILYPQSGAQISGSVMDATNSSSLPHAFLFLKNHPEFNGIADSYGEFALHFPEVLKNDTLVISLLGYHRIQVPLSRLSRTGNRIKLQQAVIALNEVVIKPEDTSLKEMIAKAIENIPKNYPDKRHQLNGLYRKVSTDYEEFTHLEEAAVVVEDVGYSKDISRAKINMEAFRQSDEHAEVDSTITLLRSRIRNQIKSMGEPVAPLNSIIGTYPSNYIRTAYVPKSHFGKEGYKFMGIPELPVYHRFVGTELIDSDTVFHIAFGYNDPPDGSNFMKINSRNHAITEYQLSYQSDEHQVYVKFREFEGRYYPEIIRLKSLRLINRDVGVHQMDIHTFWFDEVKTGKLKRIRYRDALKRDQVLEPKSYKFDAGFWENDKLIKNHPLDSAIIKSLERERSLDEQFKGNGKD